jgi:hypothetical protein
LGEKLGDFSYEDKRDFMRFNEFVNNTWTKAVGSDRMIQSVTDGSTVVL